MNPASSFWEFWTDTPAEKAKQPQDEQNNDNGPHNFFLQSYYFNFLLY